MQPVTTEPDRWKFLTLFLTIKIYFPRVVRNLPGLCLNMHRALIARVRDYDAR